MKTLEQGYNELSENDKRLMGKADKFMNKSNKRYIKIYRKRLKEIYNRLMKLDLPEL